MNRSFVILMSVCLMLVFKYEVWPHQAKSCFKGTRNSASMSRKLWATNIQNLKAVFPLRWYNCITLYQVLRQGSGNQGQWWEQWLRYLYNAALVSLVGKVPVYHAGGWGSILGRTNTQGLKIVEEKMLPLL